MLYYIYTYFTTTNNEFQTQDPRVVSRCCALGPIAVYTNVGSSSSSTEITACTGSYASNFHVHPIYGFHPKKHIGCKWYTSWNISCAHLAPCAAFPACAVPTSCRKGSLARGSGKDNRIENISDMFCNQMALEVE